MANQIIIDIGAAANDGTGDPLRTAFNYVNNNFSNVWNTGLPVSNIAFSDNRILTTATNGNLILSPNGTGKVQANVDIVPNMNSAHSLGALNRRWNTVYTQFLNVSSDVEFTGDVSIAGNLTVEGDTIQIGNIVTDTKTIQLANTALTANSANGSGVTVGANDNIATLLYNASSNTWVTNIGITAPSFTGNIGNLVVSGANIQLANSVSNNNIYIAPSGETSNAFVRIPNNNTSLANGLAVVNRYGRVEIQAKDGAATQTWYFREDGSFELPGDVPAHIKSDQSILIQTGSGDHWTFGNDNVLITPGNIIPDTSNVYSLGNATNQWADLWVSNSTIYMNSVPITLTAGNVLTVAGEPVLTNDSNTSITTTGNITADFFIGDGSQLSNVASTGNIAITGTDIAIAAGATETQITISPDPEGDAFVQIPNDATANTANLRVVNEIGNVTVETNNGTNTWTFGIDGNLTLPNGGDIVFENGDGVIGKSGDDLLISWDDEELILRSVAGDVQLEADNDIEIRSGYNFGTGDYGSRWIFNNNGELQSIPQDNANSSSYNGGYIQFVGNSSGDGYGYTTIVLRPDETVGGDQNIVIDPTAPNHIHIRAGGTQDNSSAQLYLGGETSHFSVGAFTNPPVYIKANDNQWTYGTDGGLTVPSISTGGEGEQERAEIRGTRTIVGETGTWSTYIPGHTAFGNVAWTASGTNIQSARITFVIQTNGTAFNWEQFDVAVCKLDGANAIVSVSNRIRQNSAIDYTEVSAYETEGYLNVWLNPADGQTSGYVNYHAVEFSIMPD